MANTMHPPLSRAEHEPLAGALAELQSALAILHAVSKRRPALAVVRSRRAHKEGIV